MSYKTLHNFIEQLEKEGELVRIKSFVNPEFEISEITDRISKQKGGGKALLFENTGTAFPLLINSLGSEKRISMALGMHNLDEAGERIMQLFNMLSAPRQGLWQKIKIFPSLKEIASWMPTKKSGKGDCQQNIDLNPNFNTLPVLKCWPNDGGRFVTLPLVHTTDPITGIRNVGMYRLQVFTENTTGMHWHRHKTGARHFEEYKKMGKKMPIAVALGGDPVYTYAATAPLPDNIDEYIFAGFLRNKKVELVRCITQEMYVPADADIVIEGYVDPSEPLAWEGPFGDHTGFYSLADWYPTFHVTCITHRNNAVYPATIVGIPPQEDAYIAKATERIFLSPIRLAMAPEIIDMNLPIEGVAHNLAIVKINKTFPGQAFKIMNALWGAGQMMFNKVLIVCDKDVDIFSIEEVTKACLDNVTAPSHICIQIGPADVLDHSAQSFTYGGKLCIDATKKFSEEILNPILGNTQKTDIEIITKIINNHYEIVDSNLILAEKGIVFLSVNRDAVSDFATFSYTFKKEIENAGIKLVVFFDSEIKLNNISVLAWLALGNTDPSRDINVIQNSGAFGLIVNACSKNKERDGFQREWPQIIVSDTQTIQNVDSNWEKYGLGPFISSPSISFSKSL